MGGFLNDLRRGAEDAAWEAQRLVRQQRRQLDLSKLRKERDEGALEVGNRVIERISAGELGDGELADLAAPVLALDDRIRLAEADLERIRAERPPRQAAAPGADDATSNLLCFNCGSAVPEDATYCTTCGASVRTGAGADAGAPPKDAEASTPGSTATATASAETIEPEPDDRPGAPESAPWTAAPAQSAPTDVEAMDADPLPAAARGSSEQEVAGTASGATTGSTPAPPSGGDAATGTCPVCGTPADADARYCIRCGERLRA